MYIALDEQNNRITAEDAHKEQIYRCPICEQKLELKKGSSRRHHFAHWKSLACSDDWSSDMSEWHLSWQEQFPIECREVVVEHEGKRHRADILIEEHKIVIEFQHSSLSPEEFQKRNQFYIDCGYNVVWLFDMSRAKQEQEHFVLSEAGDYYIWKKPCNTFRKEGIDAVNYSGKTGYNPIIDAQETIQGVFPHAKVANEEVAVFFERDGIIEKLLYYDITGKRVVTSRIDGEMSFTWSKYTFGIWLKKNFYQKKLYRPICRRCKKPMVLRRLRLGNWVWGCQNYGVRGINCREMDHLGESPVEVSIDNQCPFCDESLSSFTTKIECPKCGYTVRLQVEQ